MENRLDNYSVFNSRVDDHEKCVVSSRTSILEV